MEDPLPLHDYDIDKIKRQKKSYRIRLGSIRVIVELNPKLNEINILTDILIIHIVGYCTPAII